jgi:hypothetical protein
MLHFDGVKEPGRVADALLAGPLAELTAENEINKSIIDGLLRPADSPCGHSGRYAHTEDGGKHIYCYVCQNEKLTAERDRLKRMMAHIYETWDDDPLGAGMEPLMEEVKALAGEK